MYDITCSLSIKLSPPPLVLVGGWECDQVGPLETGEREKMIVWRCLAGLSCCVCVHPAARRAVATACTADTRHQTTLNTSHCFSRTLPPAAGSWISVWRARSGQIACLRITIGKIPRGFSAGVARHLHQSTSHQISGAGDWCFTTSGCFSCLQLTQIYVRPCTGLLWL